MELRKDNNIIEFYNTPWNYKSLGIKSNEISSIIIDSLSEIKDLIKDFEDKCNDEDIKFTAFRTDKNELIKILEKYGYVKTEISLEVINSLEAIDTSNTLIKKKVELNIAQYSDLQFLKKFAKKEFHYGRFLEDSLIKEENARLRTEFWIDSLYDDNKTSVLIAKYKEHKIGFMAYKKNDKTLQLILGGVISRFSHMSIYFWDELFNYFRKKQDVKFIKTIISARNIGIINLYSSFGFKIIRSYVGMHKHR